uniref:Uncharacterized protein n=1 Tax=Glossina pallidipes TaxID=7398 RepID=A0A1B0A2W8_GLOPL
MEKMNFTTNDMDGEKLSDAKQLLLAENSDEMLPANSPMAVNGRSVLKELNVNDGHQKERDDINTATTSSNVGSEKRRTFNIASTGNSAEVDIKENLITDHEKRRTFNMQEEIGDINTTMILTKTGFENRRPFNIPSIERSEKRRTFTETLAEEAKQDMIVTAKNDKRHTLTIQEETALATISVTETGGSLFKIPAEGVQIVGSTIAESIQSKIDELNEMIKENEKSKGQISQESEAKDVQRQEKTLVRKEMISNYEAMDVDETNLPLLQWGNNPVKVDIENIHWPMQANHSSSISTKQANPENYQSTLEKQNLEAARKSLASDKQKANEHIKADTVTTTMETSASSQIRRDKQASSVLIAKGKVQKRPSIHDCKNQGDVLSAKEQSSIRVRDAKELMTEKSNSPLEEMFAAASTASITLSISDHSGFDTNSPNAHSSNNTSNNAEQPEFDENEFSGNNNQILLTKGNNNNVPVDRSSLLIKFDPLVGIPLPANTGQNLAQGLKLQSQQQEQQQQLRLHLLNATKNNASNRPCLSPILEENSTEEISFVNEPTTRTFTQETNRLTKGRWIQQPKQQQQRQQQQQQQYKPDKNQLLGKEYNKKHATMSVDVDVVKDISLDNDCNKTYDNSNNTSATDDKPQIVNKMDELEKKIKNEVLKREDIERKRKDAENE